VLARRVALPRLREGSGGARGGAAMAMAVADFCRNWNPMKQNRIRVGSDDIRVLDCDAEVRY
jgi:hypothetical protein